MKQPYVLPRPALTKAEVARLLGLTENTINQYIRKGRLRAVKLSPTTVRVLFQDLEDFLANNATIPPKEFSSASPSGRREREP